MWRFPAVFGLAMIGMVWCVAFADFVQQCALITAFGAAAIGARRPDEIGTVF